MVVLQQKGVLVQWGRKICTIKRCHTTSSYNKGFYTIFEKKMKCKNRHVFQIFTFNAFRISLIVSVKTEVLLVIISQEHLYSLS